MTFLILTLISSIRIAVGLAPFIAPSFSIRTMKLPAAQIHSSTLMILRLFGVREIAVGVLSLIYRNEIPFIQLLLWINFCVDAGDALVFLLACRKDSALKNAARASGGVALLAVLGWSVALLFFYLQNSPSA